MRTLSGRVWRFLFVIFAIAIAILIVDRALPVRAPRVQRLEHDARGRVMRRHTPSGVVARYSYDDAGRLAEISYHRPGRLTGWHYDAAPKVRFSYDGAGNRIETADASGSTRYTYDELGRARTVATPDGRTINYEYDPWSRLHRLAIGGGERVEYEHDPFGQLLTASTTHGAIRFEHSGGNRTVRVLPNGVQTVYERTPSGVLTSVTHQRNDGRLIVAFHYTYDADFRVQSAIEQTPRGVRRTDYQYDPLGRLVRVTESPGTTTTYTYDPIGNRLSEGTTRYQYDSTGRLIRAGDARFEYDQAGNLVSRKGGGSSAEFDYDPEGRLTRVKRDGKTVRYTYDGEGNRVGRDDTHDALHRFTALPQVIAESSPSGQTEYVIAGSRCMQIGGDGKVLYLLEDRIGSTRFVVDAKGDVVAHYDYTPFGAPRLLEGKEATRFLFAGEAWDADAQLIYLRNRYYEPATGRFISPDPVDGVPTDPQSYNSYAYCANDPVNRTDPAGLQSSKWPPPPPPPPPPQNNWRWNSGSFDVFKSHDTYHNAIPPPPPPDPWRYSSWSGFPQRNSFEIYTGYTTPYIDPRYHELNYHPWRDWAYHFADTGFFSVDTDRDRWLRSAFFGIAFVASYTTGIGETATAIGGGLMFTSDVLRDVARRDWHGLAWEIPEFYLENKSKLIDRIGNLYNMGDDFLHISAVHDWLGDTYTFLSRPQYRYSYDILDYTSRIDPFIAGTLDRTRNIFFPPPPGGGGAFAPAVGGVYLDQTAKMIGQLGEIKGAMFDKASGRMILIGDRRTSLPPMRPEILAAALRAVYSNSPHEPGMTIDPNPQDPHAPLMLVIFFGNTENSRLGWVMYEADRLMKGYSIGRDNITRDLVQSRVPGYQSVTSMELATPQSDRGLWSRFWLVPEPVTARVSSDGASIVLDPIRMRVKTETMRWAGGRLVPAGGVRDEHAEQFAAHFSDHYGEFERENGIYGELRQVTAAVALAKWMKERGVPPDWNFIRACAKPYGTPAQTPAAYAEESKSWSSGYGMQTLRISTFGGVEMAPSIQAKRGGDGDKIRDSLAGAWKEAQKNSKDTFAFRAGDKELQAVALPAPNQRELGSFHAADADLPAAAERFAGLPGVIRSYDSFHDQESEFGHTWTLNMPRLEFDSPGKTGSMEYLSVEGKEGTRVLVQNFTLTDDFGTDAVRFNKPFVDQELDRIGFRAEKSSVYRAIYPEEHDLFRLFFVNGNQALFHSSGKLVAMLTPDSKAIYEYDTRGRLSALRFTSPARQDEVHYAYDDADRVVSMASGDEMASYDYDGQGNLAHVRSPRGDVAYRYDARRLLTAVAANERLLVENRYDGAGHLTGQGNSDRRVENGQSGEKVIVETRDGRTIRSHYDAQMRLTKIEAGEGRTATYSYDHGRVTAKIDLPGGAHARTVTDDQGRIVEVEDPRGVRFNVQYGEGGLPLAVRVNGKPWTTYRYDARGQVESVDYAGGWREEFGWDDSGRLASYRRGSTAVSFLRDDGGNIAAVESPSIGRVQLVRDGAGLAVLRGSDAPALEVASGGDGAARWIDYAREGRHTRMESNGRTVVVRSAGGAETRLNYGANGLLESVVDPMQGRTMFAYAKGRLQQVRLPGGYCREMTYDDGGRVISRGACGRE